MLNTEIKARFGDVGKSKLFLSSEEDSEESSDEEDDDGISDAPSE